MEMLNIFGVIFQIPYAETNQNKKHFHSQQPNHPFQNLFSNIK